MDVNYEKKFKDAEKKLKATGDRVVELETTVTELTTQLEKVVDSKSDLQGKLAAIEEKMKDQEEADAKRTAAKEKEKGKLRTYKIIAHSGCQYKQDGFTMFAGNGEIVTTNYQFHKDLAKVIGEKKPEDVDLPS